MKTSSFETLAALAPANATAARVVARGTGWEPAKKIIKPWDTWQDMPLPIMPSINDPTHQEMTRRLVGKKFGRLTVIGYGGKKGKSGSVWVVRCSCGMYGHKRARSLTLQHAPRCMCPQCDYVDWLKQGMPC